MFRKCRAISVYASHRDTLCDLLIGCSCRTGAKDQPVEWNQQGPVHEEGGGRHAPLHEEADVGRALPLCSSCYITIFLWQPMSSLLVAFLLSQRYFSVHSHNR